MTTFISYPALPLTMSRKTKSVTVKFDEEQLELLKTAAEEHGMTVAAYVRSSAIMRGTGKLILANSEAMRREEYFKSRGI